MTTSNLLTELGQLPISKAHKFTIDITADEQPVDITSIGAGCSSCTTVSTPKTKLAVGETATLNVIFTPDTAGFQTKMIHVNYKEGDRNLKTTLKFTATVFK